MEVSVVIELQIGGGKNFSASKLRGDKILIPVHRYLRALYAANTIQCNTTTFINVPTVKGHFGLMC